MLGAGKGPLCVSVDGRAHFIGATKNLRVLTFFCRFPSKSRESQQSQALFTCQKNPTPRAPRKPNCCTRLQYHEAEHFHWICGCSWPYRSTSLDCCVLRLKLAIKASTRTMLFGYFWIFKYPMVCKMKSLETNIHSNHSIVVMP